MASRFAVTTGNWTGAIWAATSGGAAGSAAVPTAADDVTINKNVTVTIDDTTAVALTLTLSNGTTTGDVGAILTCTTGANWKLTLERGITTTATSTAAYMSSINLDMSASAYVGELVLNNSRATSGFTWLANIDGNYQFKGKVRTRHTVTTTALVANTDNDYPTASTGNWCRVEDATGWIVGDTIVFASTESFSSPPKTDLVTIAVIVFDNAPTNTGPARIEWTDGAGTGDSVAYAHATGCPVGNFSSNLIVRPGTAGDRSAIRLRAVTGQLNVDCYVDNVLFSGMWSDASQSGALTLNPVDSGNHATTKHKAITNNAFYNYVDAGLALGYMSFKPTRSFNIFYTTDTGATAVLIGDTVGLYGSGPDEDYVIFRSGQGITSAGGQAIAYPDGIQRRHKISGCVSTSSGGLSLATNKNVEDCQFWANRNGPSVNYASQLSGCLFDSAVFPNATSSGSTLNLYSGAEAKAIDCDFPASITIGGINSAVPAKLLIVNKDVDAAFQELFQYQSTTVPAIKRNTTTVNRSTSSMEFTLNTAIAQEYEFEVLAKAGETIKILTYVRKSSSPAYGASTLPSVTISGLGITPVTSTMAGGTAADAWELLSTEATNSGSADGNLTVTFTAQSATAGAKAFFAGTPVAPFVTRARHYGYLFNETVPTVTPDLLKSASEATADAYTEVNWTWGASASSAAIVSSTTFQKLFDGHQAEAVQNVGSAVALTGAGAAGSPALFAAGNVIISDGAVLNGSGSISMGAYTLSTEFASGVNYTYTGGTFSQATTVPTFSGGTLNIGAAGTYTYVQAAAMILSMTPTAPGTYALGETTFTGEVDLRNTAAHAITVELPTGASYTTASNTGGTITVSLPVVTADISITSMPNDAAGTTRLQIINKTALSASAWAANTVYATGALVKRSTGIGSESTAGLYFRATTGGTSHATTEPTWDTTVGNTTADGTVVWTCYAVLYYDADPAATSLTDTYIDGEEFLDGEVAEIRFAEMNGSTSFKTYSTEVAITAAGFSALVAEEADAVFATFAIDGSTLEATFSPNFTSDYIVLDSNTDFAGKGAFAYYCYTLTTSAGMYNFWGGITALDEGNIRINTSILNLYFDESAGFVKQTDDIRIFRSDGSRPALDPTTGTHGIEINWRTPVSVVTTGGSAVLPQDIVDIAAASAAAVVSDGKTLTVPKFLGLK